MFTVYNVTTSPFVSRFILADHVWMNVRVFSHTSKLRQAYSSLQETEEKPELQGFPKCLVRLFVCWDGSYFLSPSRMCTVSFTLSGLVVR